MTTCDAAADVAAAMASLPAADDDSKLRCRGDDNECLSDDIVTAHTEHHVS